MMDEKAAVAAIRMKVPMIGICINSKHRDLMYERLAQVVFEFFRDPSDDLHEPALTKAIGGKKLAKSGTAVKRPTSEKKGGQAKAKAKAKAGKKTKGKAKGKAKAKAKSKGKAKKKATKRGDQEEDEEEEDDDEEEDNEYDEDNEDESEAEDDDDISEG